MAPAPSTSLTPSTAATPGGGLLHVRQLVVDHQTFTLGPVSFDIHAGQTLAVVGRSGAGKSMLLRAMVGLEEHATGDVVISECSLALPPVRDAIALKRFREEVGMSFQRGALLDDETVLENVALAVRDGAAAYETAHHALSLVGLDAAKNQFPGVLSGGMRRRVGLARALVNARSALFCDDVTAGLDPSTAAEVMDELQQITRRRGACLVVTTHDIDVVLPRADQVMVLDRGAPVFLGVPSAMNASTAARPFMPQLSPAHDVITTLGPRR